VSRRVEVLVVGGGPAGLAAGIAAAERGLQVEVVDRFAPPIDKPCGEGIMPAGLRALDRLGLAPEELAGREMKGIRYVDGATEAVGSFGASPGRGVRRLVLHEALARKAEASGVTLNWGVVVEGLEIDSTRPGWLVDTTQGSVAADWVVGADGLRSHVRCWAGLEGPTAEWQRFGVRRHYRLAPWSDRVEVHWSESCEAYVTPVAADQVGVAMLWSGFREGFDDILRRFPVLMERLEGAERVSRDRGSGPFRQRVKGVTAPRLALVGDAAGYVDALTGEGLGLAFQQAGALGRSLSEGELRSYAVACRRIARPADLLTHLTLLLARHPVLRRRVIAAMARRPELFSRLLAVQNGEASIATRGMPALLRLLVGSLRSVPRRP
jgi:flavin-dependent dehydrogenase